MKKGWKIVGAVAALAALLPYSVTKDKESDKLTVQALLWKYTNQPDHETSDRRNISIDIGFHNPMAKEKEGQLSDIDPIQADPLAAEEEISTSDIELSLTPLLSNEPEDPVQADI